VVALAFLGTWLLWRSRREHLARLVAERRDAEHAAFLALAVCGGQVLVAAFATPELDGAWFPGAQLVAVLPCAAALMAWGLRHAPRVGWALGALTVLASAWLVVGGVEWAAVSSPAPWGPAVAAFPRDDALALAVMAPALAAAIVVAWWRRRRELRH
jgi:hypothetical protein